MTRAMLGGATVPQPTVDTARPSRPRRVMDRMRRRPPAHDEPDEPSTTARWTTGTRAATVGARAALGLVLLSGPAAAGIVAVKTIDPQPVAAPRSGVDANLLSRRAIASETASQWVHDWLTTPAAQASTLTRWYAGPLQLPDVAATVTGAHPVDAIPSAPGVWYVTVTATVTPAGGTARQRYFAVPIAVSGSAGAVSAAPQAIPVPVPAPPLLQADTGDYPQTVDLDSPIGQAIAQFATAYLTGTGDVTRYVTPGAAVHGLDTPTARYTRVTVASIAASATVPGTSPGDASPPEGRTVRVLARVQLFDSATDPRATLASELPLTLRARGGRWEISGLDVTVHQGSTPNTPTPPPANL